jgi:hypothetical protein
MKRAGLLVLLGLFACGSSSRGDTADGGDHGHVADAGIDMVTDAGGPMMSGPDGGNAADSTPPGSEGGATIGTVLVPGSGFTGGSEPAPVGSATASGHDARAMARWDVVPYQSVSGQLDVGVIAFHVNGIDHVDIAVDGGPWATVKSMSLNPATGVWEYWVTLDASRFTAAKEVLLQAIAYPTAGQPRWLADESPSHNDPGDGTLRLEVDPTGAAAPTAYVAPTGSDTAGDGTQAKPYATLQGAVNGVPKLDGTTIYLEPGDYQAPDGAAEDNTRWLTVTAAPGADTTKVRLLGSAPNARWNTRRVRLQHMSIVPPASAGGGVVNPSQADRIIWFDGVTIDGGDRTVATGPTVNQADTYWTDVTIKEYANPVDTWNGAVQLARHVHAQGVLEDSFRLDRLLVDSSVDDVNTENTNRHPDVIQYEPDATPNNFIVYGLKATNVASQGIYINGTDWAIVNVLIQQSAGSQLLWQIDEGITNHVLLWHVTTVNQHLEWRNGSNTAMAKNVSVRNSCLEAMDFGPSSKGNATDTTLLMANMTIDDNHFATGMANGTHSTTGDPKFVSPAMTDFHPAPGSTLIGRVVTPIVPIDLELRSVAAGTGAIGALQAP